MKAVRIHHHVHDRAELLERAGFVFEAMRAGRLRVEVAGELPLAEVAEAHRRLESRETMGKLLLLP